LNLPTLQDLQTNKTKSASCVEFKRHVVATMNTSTSPFTSAFEALNNRRVSFVEDYASEAQAIL
jgi:hypothetical protein